MRNRSKLTHQATSTAAMARPTASPIGFAIGMSAPMRSKTPLRPNSSTTTISAEPVRVTGDRLVVVAQAVGENRTFDRWQGVAVNGIRVSLQGAHSGLRMR